ncbi:hypothetical protein BDY21DRAFT_337411 [Lineolata rhizophorae]|uniref:Secreted protein n=1 Tax=Lineolata rhizophorae TaxID=578093 RepID=A0A6A6P8K0_9PEZI|nr:hypothetical protein BDY21DRAFT_337411 [Lineolata rhizophorae]
MKRPSSPVSAALRLPLLWLFLDRSFAQLRQPCLKELKHILPILPPSFMPGLSYFAYDRDQKTRDRSLAEFRHRSP